MPIDGVADPVRLRAGAHALDLVAGAPAIMGVVNTNPGSFSDRRHLGTTGEQLARALELVEDGATIIDVGTDSGVTYDRPIPLDLQIARLEPLVRALVDHGVAVSVDTAFAQVARAGLAAGACLVNDVSGLADPGTVDACVEHGAGLVIMHTRARHKQQAYRQYADVVDDVVAFLGARMGTALERGLAPEQVLLDPGIGYAKLPEDDVVLLRGYPRVAALGRPVLTGASRKYFAGVVTGAAPPDRLPETLATVAAVRHTPGIVRVHDVGEVRRFLDVARVIEGSRDLPAYDLGDERLKWVRDQSGATGPGGAQAPPVGPGSGGTR